MSIEGDKKNHYLFKRLATRKMKPSGKNKGKSDCAQELMDFRIFVCYSPSASGCYLAQLRSTSIKWVLISLLTSSFFINGATFAFRRNITRTLLLYGTYYGWALLDGY